MKPVKYLLAMFAFVVLSHGAVALDQTGKKNGFTAGLLAATDARDAENPIFEEAIKAGKYEALVMLGQIGGDACKKLVPFLRSGNVEAQIWAAEGAAYCRDSALAPLGLGQMLAATDKSAWAAAVGFSGGEGSKEALVALLNIEGLTRDQKTAALFGLVQAVAYDRTDAADIEGLDAGRLVALVKEGGDVGYAATYVLARLQAVPDILPARVFEAAYLKLLSGGYTPEGVDVERLRLQTRLAREYGDFANILLWAAASAEERVIRHEAIRSMGYLSDDKTKATILALADGEGEAASRHLAVDALGRRSAADPALVGLLEQYVSDDNRWVATTALRWLGQRDAVAANEIAASWLTGPDYYLAFQALIALTGSDEGKAILRAYADANPETVRGFEAAVALDPSLEAITKPRKTASAQLLASYKDRELILETTRGKVCISMTGDAPYAATSFLQLADVGKMDGMLWHRVIPNFVSQAGQIENQEIANWGSIREEWGGEHRIGTVGVATAGRDTGTTQFFINTGYNMHLDGRYTVFGKVHSDMQVVYALEEGDVISKAYTAKAANTNCD